MLAPSEQPNESSPTSAAAPAGDFEESGAESPTITECPGEGEETKEEEIKDEEEEDEEEGEENVTTGEKLEIGGEKEEEAGGNGKERVKVVESDDEVEEITECELEGGSVEEAKNEVNCEEREVEKKEESSSAGEDEEEEDEGVEVDSLTPTKVKEVGASLEEEDGIVRACYKDFETGLGEESATEDGAEGGGGLMLMGNPELQKIREEQVRKWLIFEQENPAGGSLTASMDVDSLAAGGAAAVGLGNLGLINGACELEGQDGEGLSGRRVRFLTDQEGNLLISVFMSKLVHLFLFLIKLASRGYLDFVPLTTITPPIPAQFFAPPPSPSQHSVSSPRHSISSSSSVSSHCPSVILNLEETEPTKQTVLLYAPPSSSTPATPLSEEVPILLSNGVLLGDSDLEALHLQQQSPSLVVSPPSLEGTLIAGEGREEELVDSIEPSAPPLDTVGTDEDEPSSIILLEAGQLKEPPREKPPAPPTSGDDSANESSDETLSVSSCNSMIEILPDKSSCSGSYDVNPEVDEEEMEQVQQHREEVIPMEAKMEGEKFTTPEMVAAPYFQLGVLPEVTSSEESPNPEELSEEEEAASLIIHELEEHDEGMAVRNGGNEEGMVGSPPAVMISPAPMTKMPNVDENNNIVEDSVLEEEDDEEEEEMVRKMQSGVVVPLVATSPPQFNPEIGGQAMMMPELRRSTSSSDGDAEEDHMDRAAISEAVSTPAKIPTSRPQPPVPHQFMLSTEDPEAQMVSLCIQEEHISAVAVTIAKWESMSKAQSTENLNTAGVTPSTAPSAHAPVTKSASSPCPKTSRGMSPSMTQQHRPLTAKPLQPVAPLPGKESPATTRVVIHGANSPGTNEPLVVSKAAGWSCWSSKMKDSTGVNGGANGTPPIPPDGATGTGPEEPIYAQPNHQAGTTMTSITNPSAILKSYPKPLSKGEIVNWLREGEIHRAGLLLNYAQSHHHVPLTSGHAGNNMMGPVLVSWFFGLISRHQAERYLQGQPSGTFLVRISTRIWGYTLSYAATGGRIKHFLIGAINPTIPATLETAPAETALPPQSCKQQRMLPFLPQGRYAFIGTNMTPYGTLVSLIRHHSHAPITKLGGEKLLTPCPGGPQVAGLESLFQKSALVPAPPAPSTSTSAFMIPSA